MAKKDLSEIGKTGTSINSGVITGEDYNAKVSGESGLKVYDEMRRSDATVNASLDALKKPIKNAKYFVDPASEEQADIDVAEFINDCLFHIVDWKQALGEILTYLDFGFDVHEAVYEAREINGTLRIALVKLGYRKQTTIKKWVLDDGNAGVQQQIDGNYLSIPMERVVRFTHKQEGDNFEGISVLRTSYQNWYIKSRLYKIDAVGHERHSLGVLDITTPKGALDKDKKSIRRAARNMRANEQSYIEHPDGYVVAFLDMKAGSMKNTEPSIMHHDRQIMKNVHAQFLELGANSGSGSKAVSVDHSKLLQLSLQEIAEYIVHVLQHTVVRTLVDLNFTGREYPTLRVSKIDDDDVALLSEAITKFVTAGMIHPNGADENTTRRMLGLKELDEEQIAEIDYSAKPTVLPTAGGVTASAEIKQLRASVEKALTDEARSAA
jgi:phage gp29-like protein